MKKRVIKIILFYFSCIFGLLGISLYSYSLKIEQNNTYVEDNRGIWRLSDEYDTETSNYYDFLNQENALKTLNEVYKELSNNSQLKYYEVSDQVIAYLGKFKGDRKFSEGSYNEKIDNKYQTNLRSYQLPYNLVSEQELNKKIKEGRGFEKQDYQNSLTKTIPIIAGYNYQKVFKKNQKIKVNYLMGEYTFKIVGFLKKNTKILIMDERINVDHTLIMPVVMPGKNDSKKQKEIVMSVKCSGYYIYRNYEDLKKISKKVKNVRSKTGYRYVIPMVQKQSENLLGISIEQSFFLMVISGICQIWCIWFVIDIESEETIGNILYRYIMKNLLLLFSGLYVARSILIRFFGRGQDLILSVVGSYVIWLMLVFFIEAVVKCIKSRKER